MDLINELNTWFPTWHEWRDKSGLPELLALIAFAVPLWHATVRFIRQIRSSHYSELDRIYMDILKMSIDRQYLRNEKQIELFVAYLKAPEQKPPFRDKEFIKKAKEYDVYAFIVFNFLETIHDRCDENRYLYRFPDKRLLNTWRGIIGEEYRLHHKWFFMEATRNHGERMKFCLGFIQFMLAERWSSNYWGYFSDTKIRKKFIDFKPKNPKMKDAFNRTKWAGYLESISNTIEKTET